MSVPEKQPGGPSDRASPSGTAHLLPSYSPRSRDRRQDSQANVVLIASTPTSPGNEAPPTRMEHVFKYPDVERRQPWAKLRLESWTVSVSKQPLYHPGDEIRGFLDLNLIREKTFKSIIVQVSE